MYIIESKVISVSYEDYRCEITTESGKIVVSFLGGSCCNYYDMIFEKPICELENCTINDLEMITVEGENSEDYRDQIKDFHYLDRNSCLIVLDTDMGKFRIKYFNYHNGYYTRDAEGSITGLDAY